MKAVFAQFLDARTGDLNPKRYEYFVRPGDDPQVGDLLITSPGGGGPTAYGNEGRKFLNVAKVTEVAEEATSAATRFYLKLLPLADLAERQEENARLIKEAQERAEKERERKRTLAKLRELAESRELIRKLADSDDPEIRALIEKLS